MKENTTGLSIGLSEEIGLQRKKVVTQPIKLDFSSHFLKPNPRKAGQRPTETTILLFFHEKRHFFNMILHNSRRAASDIVCYSNIFSASWQKFNKYTLRIQKLYFLYLFLFRLIPCIPKACIPKEGKGNLGCDFTEEDFVENPLVCSERF